MIKDIPRPRMQDFALAIVPPEENWKEELWDVFLLNLKEEPIRNILIAAKGYGEIDGEQRQTALMRHFFELIEPLAIKKVEPIHPAVFELTNEYWVSFSYEGHLYDKKYVFVKGSIAQEHFTPIPFLGKKGVMIQ